MLRAECPECGETVELRENARVGDRVICVECSTELEILSLHPLELDYALEEDWDEEWEEEEGEDEGLYEEDEWDEE